MATKPLITPRVLTNWTQPDPKLVNALSLPLANLHTAGSDELVGYAAAHCLPWSGMPKPVSEYLCAFLATGDEDGCKPTAFLLPDAARKSIDLLKSNHFRGGRLARRLHAECGIRMQGVQLETVVFRDFMITFPSGETWPRPKELDVRIYATPAATTEEASRRAQEIRMVFGVLGSVHDLLEQYRFGLPAAEQLVQAPADAEPGRPRRDVAGRAR